MAQEVIIRLRDDLTGQLDTEYGGPETNIRLIPFSFNGVDYELHCGDTTFEQFKSDIARYIKAGRKAKKSKVPNTRVRVRNHKVEKGRTHWNLEIKDWCAKRGIDWSEKTIRGEARQWAIANDLLPGGARGMMPRGALEAWFAAHYVRTANGYKRLDISPERKG